MVKDACSTGAAGVTFPFAFSRQGQRRQDMPFLSDLDGCILAKNIDFTTSNQWRRGSTVFGVAKGSNFPTKRQFFRQNQQQ